TPAARFAASGRSGVFDPGALQALASQDPAGELRARPGAELAVDRSQVRLDRLDAEEEGGGDLVVRQAAGDELGDPLLARREPSRGRRAAADPPQLVPGPLRPQARAQLLELPKRLLERVPCRTPPPRPPLRRPEGDERPRELERVARPPVLPQRLAERVQRAFHVAAGRGDDAAAPAGDRERPGPVERACPLVP